MDEARAKALQGAEEGAVIVASQQTQGRGRRERVWESPKGNLYLTYITYPDCILSHAPQLSLVACVAVGEALRPLLPPGNCMTYKWPNDVLLNGKKVAGLLLEAISIPEKRGMGYLIGCGANVTTYPLKTRYPATSFQNEGVYLSLEEVLHRIVSSFQRYISLWQRAGFPPINDLWMKDAVGLGTRITFDVQGKVHEGIFKGIDGEGALMLETPQGIIKLTAGEILEREADGFKS